MDNKVNIIFELLKKGSGAQDAASDLKHVSESANESAESLEHLKQGFEKLIATFAVEKFLEHSVEAFLEFDKALAKLNGALQSSGQFSEAYSEELEKMAFQFSLLSTFSKASIADLIGRLIAFGATKDNIKPLTLAALDLGTVLGRDLPAASQVITAALNGEFGPATRALRINIDESKSATENFQLVMERIAAISAGQAKASVDTLSGAVDQQKKKWEEMAEIVGHKVVASYFAVFEAATKADNAMKSFAASWWAGKLIPSASGSIGSASPGDWAALQQTLGGVPSNPFLSTPATLAAGSGGRGSEASSPTVIHNLEKERTALLELQKIQAQIHSETLVGLEAERAKIMEKYDEQEKAIYKNSNIAQEAESVTSSRLLASQEARANQLSLVTQKTQEAQNKHNTQIAEQELILRDQIAQENLLGIAAEIAAEETRFQQRQRHIQNDWDLNDQEYADLISLEEKLHSAKLDHIAKEHDARYQLSLDMKKWGDQAEEQFSSGLGSAIVDAFQSGDKAFQQFAANFLKSMASMILQSLILRSVQSAFGTSSNNFSGGGSIFGSIFSGGGTSTGGSGAISGINLGGAAFTDAYTGVKSFSPGQVPTRSRGGDANITITMHPSLIAEVTHNSIQGARVTVAQDLTQDTPISRAAKRLTA